MLIAPAANKPMLAKLEHASARPNRVVLEKYHRIQPIIPVYIHAKLFTDTKAHFKASPFWLLIGYRDTAIVGLDDLAG